MKTIWVLLATYSNPYIGRLYVAYGVRKPGWCLFQFLITVLFPVFLLGIEFTLP